MYTAAQVLSLGTFDPFDIRWSILYDIGYPIRHFPHPHIFKSLPPIRLSTDANHNSVAVGAAIYSSAHKLMTDKTLRLSRNAPKSPEEH
ncbi:uncharacterized protein LDX57_005230 [Aspergillus melleus]|uniref:uncharacterized protein n=1 Tax=Aspergillus melleus TaxID=138277 RepID=UPI001E8CB641|nr:uncharacterized protein LDX57_005230 [Aspergillus melleus]KAH8427517.1 hypothetical protein LDX57_005230 [Aspergillus melleus]